MGGRNRLLTQFAGAVLCVQLCATVPSDGATVSIDPTITYSTIDGLGFCAPPKSMYKVRQGPFMVDAEWEPFAETLITYVGMTMSRGFDTRSCEFNPSPGEYVITASIREEMEKQRLLQHIADSCGEPYHFAPNVFSPAPWMKANNACSEGANSSQNRLEADHYADFAAMCSAYVRISIDMFEVPVYALSPQNEPAFSLTYASCVYTARSYTDMLRFVGPAVERASPTTLIYGCEHMLHVFPS
jgi:glucuronoarabinoxylan endo-1,4-beta-xylanase